MGTWIALGWAKFFFRRPALCSTTGFSQREKHHQSMRTSPPICNTTAHGRELTGSLRFFTLPGINKAIA
jgi:hypothetical protein